MQISNFNHAMAAHCETGTIAAMLRHAGVPMSEPMVFGVAGGFFFAYLETATMPFPTFVMRSKPGDIRKKISKRVNARFEAKTFKDNLKAQPALDALVSQNIPVALQVDMFHMDYIPSYMKVHFNGHFVIVVGKENDKYIISDCYYPQLAQLPEASLEKARFTRGMLAPKGLQYYISSVLPNPDMKKIIIQGIKDACWNMLTIPIPFIGVKGIRRFAKKVIDWPSLTRDIEHLSHEIVTINIILEERGTGGAGFRFMYATFLQEAAKILGNGDIAEMSNQMMGIGDRWREISLFSARIGKNRDFSPQQLKHLQEMILSRADEEEQFFKKLKKIVS